MPESSCCRPRSRSLTPCWPRRNVRFSSIRRRSWASWFWRIRICSSWRSRARRASLMRWSSVLTAISARRRSKSWVMRSCSRASWSALVWPSWADLVSSSKLLVASWARLRWTWASFCAALSASRLPAPSFLSLRFCSSSRRRRKSSRALRSLASARAILFSSFSALATSRRVCAKMT